MITRQNLIIRHIAVKNSLKKNDGTRFPMENQLLYHGSIVSVQLWN